jgi:hypothetical protein
MRIPVALWMLCLVVAGCGKRDAAHSKAPEPKAAAAVTISQNQSTFELIEQLEKVPALTPEEVMKTMHVELRHDPENSGPTFKAYTQPTAETSPYKSIELRMPNEADANHRLLIVQLVHDGGVTRKEIIARYGLDFETQVPSPEAQDLPIYLRYKRPYGSLSLGVTKDDARLVGFTINKGEK